MFLHMFACRQPFHIPAKMSQMFFKEVFHFVEHTVFLNVEFIDVCNKINVCGNNCSEYVHIYTFFVSNMNGVFFAAAVWIHGPWTNITRGAKC